MDIQSFRYFDALAKTLHFGRASQLCFLSPSALSRSIAQLESAIGAQLVDRSQRQIQLTSAGKVFAQYVRSALDEWDAVRDAVQAETQVLRGAIRVYCSVTASYSFLHALLADFRQRHPYVELYINTGASDQALSRVMSGEEDLAIGALPQRLPKGLAFKSIAKSGLVFVAGESMVMDQTIDWSSVPMIVPETGVVRDRVNQWFYEKSLTPDVFAQVKGSEAIVSMASLGLGVGVVPKIVVDNSPLKARVRVLSVRPKLEPIQVGLFCLEKRTMLPLIQALWET